MEGTPHRAHAAAELTHAHTPHPPRQEEQNHVSFHRLNVTTDLILPASFLGVTFAGAIFVLVVLVLWWRNHAPWKRKDDRTMDCGDVKKVSRDPPRIVEEASQDILDVKYVEERETVRPTVVTARNYGGSSPKVLEEEKPEDKQFVFPPEESQPGTSRGSDLTDQTKLKIPLPEQTWLSKKSYDCKPYRATIPRQLVEVAKTELGNDLNVERVKKFSVTRSPSLEKDDKSPFVSSAACDKAEVFAFEPEKIKRFSMESDSPIVETRVQPHSEQAHNILDRNFNNNVTPISPKVAVAFQTHTTPGVHLRTSSLDAENEKKEKTNLRRFRSVNTKLNICSTTDVPVEIQHERLAMQNSPTISPGILECSTASDKPTKINFSPRLLANVQYSPKFFTPTDRFSPRFFPEGSPKSVYYDSVRSPMFFPDTPKSPAAQEGISLSPKAFGEQNNRHSPKLLSLEQHSPRILGKPRSPKVYSGNKENYFNFESSATQYEIGPIDEVDNSSVIKKPNYIQRYAGRKSIERERVATTEKLDARRYKRHNSCDTYNRNFDNGNTIGTIVPDNGNAIERMQLDQSNIDECCAKVESMKISSQKEEQESTLNSHTAHQRRQRLKSISLDSDNAKIIEQNLGLPIARHLKQDNLNEALQDYSSSCSNVKRSGTCEEGVQSKFNFDGVEVSKVESNDFFTEDSKYSPDITSQKKTLRDSSDTQSFIDMPRFSPKEFEVIITVDEEPGASLQKRKRNKNLRNLTIDLTRRDSDLEKELMEFEKLYCEDKKVKTPTLKIKATSLDSSESVNFSLPQQKTLEVPQNSISVPNTPKRQYKRILAQKNFKIHDAHCGGKLGYNSLQSDQRRFIKWQPAHLDSGIFLKENHANLMLYQPSTSRGSSRRMGSFDENIADCAENAPEINVNQAESDYALAEESSQCLGSNLLSFKPNLSISSTNLKTLPEGVPSNDFQTRADGIALKKLNRRESNQSLKLSFDQGERISTLSLQSSNCSLPSSGLSCQNLASMRNSTSNYSLNTDCRQKVLERRNSNTTLTVTTDHLAPVTRTIGSSNVNLQASNTNLCEGQCQPAKNCLLQRRGSNNSLSLNIQNSSTNLHRFSSNSSLNINKEAKTGQRKGLLERRSSNTSLTLNINTSNPQLSTNRGLSISNYNLDGSTCNLSLHNSNQSVNNPAEPRKGILERRSSNTSLTINIQNQDQPRAIEIDEKVLETGLKDLQIVPQREKHRKSLSTENLIPKSYKYRNQMKHSEKLSFGSHDDLWLNSYDTEALQEGYRQNLTYVCGDPENEIIYACGAHEHLGQGQIVRNITTKPLSPQTTSEDFKTYLANIQHLQNASSVLTRKQLKDLNNVFQNGYSKVKCDGSNDNGHRCSPREPSENPQMAFPEAEPPCSEYQKSLLRNLHKEFWDLPSNFQDKPMVFGSHPKNRYKTILPNEHSRFLLRPDGEDTAEGYVNANFIKGHEYTKNSYIATQGPMPNTIYDFWLMVHQNSSDRLGAKPEVQTHGKLDSPPVQKIVMLTNFVENNRQKCEKYFPLEVDEEIVFENPEYVDIFSENSPEIVKNSFVIRNSGVVQKCGYTIRRLHVSQCGERGAAPTVEVCHYWFHNWADHKCPKDVNALLNLSLDILNNRSHDFDSVSTTDPKCLTVESPSKFVFPPTEETLASCSFKPFSPVSSEDEGSPPTIVHCSAGIGRTGCLIAILNGIKQLHYEDKVDVLGIVCNMRLNRGGMVQNSEQYELIHKVLCLYEQMYLQNA